MHKILPKENIHLYQADMDKEYENIFLKRYMYIFLHAKHCPIKRLNGGFSEGEGFLLSLIQKYFGHNRPNS